jgi:hypothetical protein
MTTKVSEKKEAPKQFFPTEDMDIFNEDNPHNLLLLAWNLMQRRNATSATMIAISESGFILEITLQGGLFSKDETKRFTHKYEEAVVDEKEFREYFKKLVARSNAPSISSFFATVWAWFVLMMWTVLATRYTADEATITRTSVFYGYYVVYQSSLFFFVEKQNAIIALALLVFSHTVEALYVAYVCLSMGFGWMAVISWSFATFIIGYPVITRLMLLDQMKRTKGVHVKVD